MPQLDFFIFPLITVQSTLAFFLLIIIVYNGGFLQIFKNLKTRKLFSDTLIESSEENYKAYEKLYTKQFQEIEKSMKILPVETILSEQMNKIKTTQND